MNAGDLREVLQVLQDFGVSEASIPDSLGSFLAVKFLPPSRPVPVGPFVDKDGKPVNLDEGLPALARDPDAAEPDPIEAANFAKVKPGS